VARDLRVRVQTAAAEVEVDAAALVDPRVLAPAQRVDVRRVRVRRVRAQELALCLLQTAAAIMGPPPWRHPKRRRASLADHPERSTLRPPRMRRQGLRPNPPDGLRTWRRSAWPARRAR